MKSNLQKIRSKFILSTEIITSHIKDFFQSVWLQDAQTEIQYLHKAIYILFSEIKLYVSNSSLSDFILRWRTRQSTKAWSSTLAWPMKTLAWLLMLSWKEHRNFSHDHYYTILKSLSTLSNKTFSFLITYMCSSHT